MKTFFSWLLLALASASMTADLSGAAVTAPDWADRMVGRWHGEGARTELATGSQTLVDVSVTAEWHPELPYPAVISRNFFRETSLDADGNPLRTKEYERVYWVRESSRVDSRAEILLGAGNDSAGSVGSRGFFDAAKFLMIVQQDLGSGIRVSSQSEMSQPDLTIYSETFWMNGRKKIQTEIRYQREP